MVLNKSCLTTTQERIIPSSTQLISQLPESMTGRISQTKSSKETWSPILTPSLRNKNRSMNCRLPQNQTRWCHPSFKFTRKRAREH